jgi:hypothetical protein
MNRLVAAGALVLMVVAAGVIPAQAEGCPRASVEIRREQFSDGHWRIYCEEISKLTLIEIATLDPAAVDRLSPDDRAALDRRKPRGRVQTVDSHIYVTPEWIAYARRQQQHLIARRAMLMRLLAGLQDRSSEFTNAITENDALARTIIEDDMASTLTVIGEAAKGIAQEAGLPAEIAAKIDVSINTALAGLNSLSAARTSDEKRKADKVVDAGTSIKNLVLAYPALPLSDKERAAIVHGTDALFAMAKISQRWADGERFDLKRTAAAADDAVEALTSLPQLSPAKALRATVHMAMAQYTLGRFQQDQAELAQAYRNHSTAEEFLNAKIAQTDEWLSVYQSSLSGQPSDRGIDH